jgi:hypothetical protein
VNAWILLAALWCGPPAIEDGSLLFLENSNRFVEIYTSSTITHVAVVMHEGSEPWVYEATPSEVRRIKLEEYYEELGKLNQRRRDDEKIRVWLARPRTPYKAQQRTAINELLKAQVGRRYSIKGYVRGQSDGIHCAELAARALCAASVLELDNCQQVSPAVLHQKMVPLSQSLTTIAIAEPTEKPGWYQRTSSDAAGYCNWCRWSCWETWMFCW